MTAGQRQHLGRSGEDAAARWYEANGYQIVARNWRCREGELDIVAATSKILAFCEVKTRSSDRFGLPVEAVTWAKQRKIRLLATRFLAEQVTGGWRELRFDVAAVREGQVEVIEAAF